MTRSARYGPWTALAFVVGTVVGTGIYLKPAQVARLAPEPWQNLTLWAAGGIFALCGALAYARLASVWPASGGAYVYLRNCYGERVGSALLASDVLLARPAAVGALATGLGLIWKLSPAGTVALAVSTLLILTLTQLMGRQTTGGLQVALTLAQMMPLAMVAGSGASLPPAIPEPASAQPVLWASGFLAVIWAYDGWYNVTILGGQVERPEVNLRRALLGGVVLVTTVYVGLNALLLSRVPRAKILEQGVPFGILLDGWGLGILADLLRWGLSLALLSTLNGVLVCGPSMMAAGGLVPERDESASKWPALLFSAWCLGLLLLFAGLPSRFALFDQLSEYTAAVVAGFSGLTVSCVFRLPDLGYKVDWPTRAAAGLFLVIDGTLVVLLAWERPLLALGGALSVMVAGAALHRLRMSQEGAASSENMSR